MSAVSILILASRSPKLSNARTPPMHSEPDAELAMESVPLSRLPGFFVSHRRGLLRYSYNEASRSNVTDGPAKIARGTIQVHRSRLRAVAYRMLGSLSDADDAVQETWLRLSRSGASGIDNLAGWLTMVVARICLDMLRSRKSRREEPLSAHVPEPIVYQDGIEPEQEAALA